MRAGPEEGDFTADLASGLAPLTFDRAANPDGEAPRIVADGGRPALRLAVRAGAYGGATAGMPDHNDRCEVREPGKLPLSHLTLHRFALRLDAGFPRTSLRCVVAQMKGNDGRSPLFALRVHEGRLFADWRLPGVTVEHHEGLPGRAEAWHSYALVFGPDAAELRMDGAVVTRARADFGPPWHRRYLKFGPYRDRHPGWGAAAAAVIIRDVSRARLG